MTTDLGHRPAFNPADYEIVGDAASKFNIYENGVAIFGPFDTSVEAVEFLEQMAEDEKAAEEPVEEIGGRGYSVVRDGYTEVEPEELDDDVGF